MRKRGSIVAQQLYSSGYNAFYQLGNGDTIPRSSPVAVAGIGTAVYKSWSTLSAGLGYVMALNSVGEMYVWGDNTYGVWGMGTTDQPTGAMEARNRSSPTLVTTSGKWSSLQTGGWTYVSTDELSVGSSATTYAKIYLAGVKTDGTLWTWGSNRHGTLGTSEIADGTLTRSSPIQVGLDADWADVSVGAFHALGLKTNGDVYAWGWGSNGILGNNSTVTLSSPVLATTGFAKVYAVGLKSFAIDTTGQLYYTGPSVVRYPDVGVTRSNFTIVTGASNITLASFGPMHGLFIRSNGTLWAAGDNIYGQLGNSSTITRSSFVQVGAGTTWTKVKSAVNHSLGLTSNGNLYVWGRNQAGQLGLGDKINRSSPVLVATGVADMGVALYTSYWLKTDGTLWSVGSRTDAAAAQDDGLLGDSPYRELNDLPTIERSSPIQIGSGYDTSIFSFDSDYNFGGTGKFLYDGDLYMWGTNGYYLGSTTPDSEYAWFKEPNGKYRKFPHSWNAVSAGTYHCAAIKSDGSLWTWGSGAGGALGLNSTTNKLSPNQVGTDTDWVSVSCGSSFTSGLKSVEGTGYVLYVWGYNGQGQLGQNIITNRSSPVNVASTGGVGWKRVEAGGFTIYAVDTNNDLYSWGSNSTGQLGLGHTLNRSNPVYVTTLSDPVISIGSGGSHVHVLDSLGKLRSVGYNAYGQLGTSDITSRSSLVQVGSSSWTAVSAGLIHSAGITLDKRLWAWGRNTTGQLNSSLDPAVYTYKNAPNQFGTRSSWTVVAAGSSSISDGTTWAALTTNI